jgi:hypothetical protein
MVCCKLTKFDNFWTMFSDFFSNSVWHTSKSESLYEELSVFSILTLLKFVFIITPVDKLSKFLLTVDWGW